MLPQLYFLILLELNWKFALLIAQLTFEVHIAVSGHSKNKDLKSFTFLPPKAEIWPRIICTLCTKLGDLQEIEEVHQESGSEKHVRIKPLDTFFLMMG